MQIVPIKVNTKDKIGLVREKEKIQLLICLRHPVGSPPDGRVYCSRATLQIAQRNTQPGISSRQISDLKD